MARVKTINLDAIVYTPIYPSVNSYRVEIINNTSVLLTLRSDPSDATTSLSVYPGESKLFEALKNTYPFDPSNAIMYGILASGTGTVKVLAH